MNTCEERLTPPAVDATSAGQNDLDQMTATPDRTPPAEKISGLIEAVHKAAVRDGHNRLDMHAQADGFIGQVISLLVVVTWDVCDREVKRAG